MSEAPNPFEWHEPPPGGLQSLRERIAHDHAPSPLVVFGAVAAAVVIAGLASLLWNPASAAPQLPPEFARSTALMSMGIVQAPNGVELVGDGALQPILSNGDVVYVRHVAR